MKVLIVGSGGREHALAWKIAQSPRVEKLYCAPGNAGISQYAECVAIGAMEFEKLADFAEENEIGLTVVGMDDPLVGGIVDVFEACIDGTLDRIDLQFEDNACVCVVLASAGYPVKYEKGLEIRGLEKFQGRDDCFVFHAGTAFKDGKIVTNGGRVLGAVAVGDSLRQAGDAAYDLAERIHFDNAFYRRDIGRRALEALRGER